MSHVEHVSIESFAKAAYLAYAMKVVKDRAIPDVEDGIKPVQRRILFAMQQLKLLGTSAKPMKCARVVGDVIGKYHPHGDSAVYEAMVRMAQPFSLRYPLVDGQGNFGSRDGDSPAAMRYTEARLTPIASALLDELAWSTVDYKPTYDNSHEEPVTLPSRLPFLLLNGSYGIAVGMATNLLPHNLLEVVEASKLLLSKPKAKFEEVMEHIHGPDFPTGGKLISSREDILKTYLEGRGSLRLRSQWVVEPVGKSWRLVITELPQDTSTAKIMVAMDELIDPKPVEKNGKKQPLKPEQLRLKKMFGDMIDGYVDGSDEAHPVRLVIDPKDRKMDPEVLAMALCAHTDMEMNVSPNFVCVDNEGNPRQGGIVDWLRQWCEYRVETVRRRLTDEKARVDRRLHLLAGRLSILDRIEEVIKVLKKSVEPRKDLMEKFGLDEIQAEDVLEMRLRQLANLEKTKILDEQAKLLLEQDRLAKLLGDEKLMRKLIIKELEVDAKSFGDARRTEVMPSESANAKKQTESLASERLSPEPIAVVLTERGWLGWRPAKSFEEAKEADFKVKAGDSIRRMWVGDRNADHAVFMDEGGRAYSLKLTDLPSKADMLPLTTWFDFQARIVEGAVGGQSSQWIVMGNSGYGFVVKGSDWINRMKAGKAFLSLGEKDRPLPPIPLQDGVEPTTTVLVLSTDGRAVGFPLSDIKVLPKGKGVGFIGLAKEHMVSDAALVQEGLALKTAKGTRANLPPDISSWVGTRSSGKKGKALHKQSEGAIFIRPGRETEQV